MPRQSVKGMLLRTLWTCYAVCYDRLLSVQPYVALVEQVVSLAEIKRGHRVLDVGAGTGNALWLHRTKPQCGAQWFLLDAVEAMLRRARRKFPDLPAGHFLPINFDADRSSLQGCFHRFILLNSLYASNEPVAVLRWLAEHAEAGAILVATGPLQGASIKQVLDGQPHRLRLILKNLPAVLINQLIIKLIGGAVFTAPQDVKEAEAWFTQAGLCVRQATTTYGGANWLIVASR